MRPGEPVRPAGCGGDGLTVVRQLGLAGRRRGLGATEEEQPMQVADCWFERTPVDASVTLITEPHVDPLLRANIWHVRGTERDLLIDAGLGIASLRTAFPDLFDRPRVVVATHAHVDHTGGIAEFEAWSMHELEQAGPTGAEISFLVRDTYPQVVLADLGAAGYSLPPILIDALPHAGFDPATFRPQPSYPTGHLREGDVIGLGARHRLTVLHLPGHTPGGIGLWDEQRRILFSGDTIYDGPLLDGLAESSIPDYITTMQRLRDLPVEVVHAGHDPSFGRARFIELIDQYLSRRQPSSRHLDLGTALTERESV